MNFSAFGRPFGTTLGTFWCMFSHWNFEVDFGVVFSGTLRGLGGGLRQRRGSAEGGEASPPSYARYCAYSLARPATSDEVRRIPESTL